MRRILHLFTSLMIVYSLTGCSVSKQIGKQANTILLKDSAISTGHIGICIYEPATNKYWYENDATHYFIPASNTKLFTLYAGMKYLGDSLVGLRYQNIADTAINIFPTGDPTFLHNDFKNQPVLNFLMAAKKVIFISQNKKSEDENALGYGWAWDDYNGDYMAERSPMPIAGNTVTLSINKITHHKFYVDVNWETTPSYFKKYVDSFYSLSYKWRARRDSDSALASKELQKFSVRRNLGENIFKTEQATSKFSKQEIPFYTDKLKTVVAILQDDYKINIKEGFIADNGLYPEIPSHFKIFSIHSQLTDSLFKPMMHRSDNFFAEQTLLMASNEHLGYMNDEKIIDTILKTDLKDIPQRPKWVDGSGLSRYNLFTPKSFVYILNKMKNEFGFNRMKNILATGGEGTISAYFKKDAGFIWAKTGTLSNNCALSGYLITNKGKLLIFSVLANNYITGATPVRRAVERFLEGIREKY